MGLNGPRPGKYRHIGLPLAPGTSLGAAQGGGHPGSAVMGRRPAARGLPWVRVVSVWDVIVSVWRPLGGRSKRLVSVCVLPWKVRGPLPRVGFKPEGIWA